MIRIATRGSKLALWQAGFVRDAVLSGDRAVSVELVVIKTRGDEIVDRPLSAVGGKGLFVKEIEAALLEGRADVAVHSMKDLPVEMPVQLVVAAVPAREDARDALVTWSSNISTIEALPQGARVGTSSLRRQCQLRALRPDLEIVALRGNVDTRLGKLDGGELEAVLLATAGLVRLGFSDRIAQRLDARTFVPAIGQGALAIQCRRDDQATIARLAPLHHLVTAIAVQAERAFLKRLQGDCQTPLGAHATVEGETLHLIGLVGTPDGTKILRGGRSGPSAQSEALGIALADELLTNGADQILR